MSKFQGIKFTEADIVEIDDWIPEEEYNPHRVVPWLLHDHGFVVAVCFASCLQDAIDAAVDDGKMERYLLSDEDIVDYDGGEDERISYLGNAGEPHDIETLEAIELPNPKPLGFCDAFDAMKS
jgi:hypothetical protein